MKISSSKNQTSDYINFDTAIATGKKLMKDSRKHKIGFYILLSINTGLRVSDTIKLTWEQLENDNIIINEKKTGKKRNFKINGFMRDIINVYGEGKTGNIFNSQKGGIYTTQQINRLLKSAFKSQSKKHNISSHSLRKTFGRKLYLAMNESEKALMMLSMLFNHTSTAVTRTYLGLRHEEFNNAYDLICADI